MKFPHQLLLKFVGLAEEPPPFTPATPGPPPMMTRARRKVDRGFDEELTLRAKTLLKGRRGLRPLAEKLVVTWNGRLLTTAGTANPRKAEIELNPRLQDLGSFAIIDRVLRHELAHLVAVHRAGRRKIAAHGPEWKEACAELGIPGESRCHNLPLPGRKVTYRYAYRCQHCGHILKRVKPLTRNSACYECCRNHNGGRYDVRFRYWPVAYLPSEDRVLPGSAPHPLHQRAAAHAAALEIRRERARRLAELRDRCLTRLRSWRAK